MLLKLDLNNCSNPRSELPPQAGTVGTRHDERITSASCLTPMLSSLQKRVYLDSSDHMTFHYFRVQSLCSLGNWSLCPQLASVIIGFLNTRQLFSPKPLISLHFVHVEMLLLSLINITLSSTGVFLFLSDCPSGSFRFSFSMVSHPTSTF